MKLLVFKSLWGVNEPIEAAAESAARNGFDGIESRVPLSDQQATQLKEALDRHGLAWIAEICTGGDYVPPRKMDVSDHLRDLETGLAACLGFNPVRVNCIGGLDAWDIADSRAFLQAGMEAAKRLDLPLCFETHRSRSMFNPWITEAIVKSIPDLHLTADISHWCVVAERLMDAELDSLTAIAPNVRHIHARVGYDQGPQVPHPAAPEFKECLKSHQQFWELFWEKQVAAGIETFTVTPEFGPDGYLHRLPFTDAPVADLDEINRWMAATEREHFTSWRTKKLTGAN